MYNTLNEFWTARHSEQPFTKNEAWRFAKENGVIVKCDYAEVRVTWVDGNTYCCREFKTKSGAFRKRCNWTAAN